MNKRIREFLKAENKSSAQMAEEIGVQPSGISHILSERNNPSLDFILKMLERYEFLSTDWLLFGKGSMYKDVKMQSLFDENPDDNAESRLKTAGNELQGSKSERNDVQDRDLQHEITVPAKAGKPAVEKIVWFYDNNSFEEYYPGH